MGRDGADKVIIEVEKPGKLEGLLNGLVGAINRHSDAIVAALKTNADNQKLDALIEMVRGLASLPANLELLKDKADIIHRLVAEGTGGDNGPVLIAINNLNRKVDEFMATQEERLRGVKTKLDAIQAGVDKIQQQLAELKANNPELEDEIAAIEETANAIDTDVNPVVTPGDGGNNP